MLHTALRVGTDAEDGRLTESLDPGPGPLCGRPMVQGLSADRHHRHPRLKGRREWSFTHQACHRMTHRTFSEADLARAKRRYSRAGERSSQV
ncbi:MAG: hypothetical protein ACPGNT_11670 [Rhodospirillales bacterium]